MQVFPSVIIWFTETQSLQTSLCGSLRETMIAGNVIDLVSSVQSPKWPLGTHSSLGGCQLWSKTLAAMATTFFSRCCGLGNFVPKQRRFSKMMLVYIRQSQSLSSSHPSFPIGIHVCSLHLCLYLCFVNKIIHTNFFFRFHVDVFIYESYFSLSDLLHFA